MNILVLFLMKKMLKLRAGIPRILMGSMAGTIIMVVVFLNTMLLEWEKAVIYYILLSITMVRIVFGKASVQVIIVRSFCMYVLAFFIGGLGNFISYQIRKKKCGSYYFGTNAWNDSTDKEWYDSASTIGIEEIFILAGIILILLPIVLKVSEYIKQEYFTKCKVTLHYEGNSVTGMALIDTGNQLRDWLTNRPVTVVQMDFINNLLEENIKRQIEGYQRAKLGKGAVLLNTKEKVKLKYIPYHSLGNENGMLIGMYLDRMTLFIKGKKIEIKHPLVGIYTGKLSENQDYQIILHQEFVE